MNSFVEMNSRELMEVTGGDIEDAAFAALVAIGAAGAIVCVASIPFTGPAGAAGALACAGGASYGWGCLID